MPYGGVYSKVSAASMADPNNKQLAALKQTTFQGTTLRGLLLEAYACSKIGAILLWGVRARDRADPPRRSRRQYRRARQAGDAAPGEAVDPRRHGHDRARGHLQHPAADAANRQRTS
jgi:hypothetical protein